MEMTDEMTQKILSAYKQKRAKEKERYERNKADPEFVKRNRERAKAYYLANKDKTRETYKMNAEIRGAKSLLTYYESQGRVDEFILKYPQRYALISELQDKPPS